MFCSILLPAILFWYPIIFLTISFHSLLFWSSPSYLIPFLAIFYRILFCATLITFYPVLVHAALFYSIPLHATLFDCILSTVSPFYSIPWDSSILSHAVLLCIPSYCQFYFTLLYSCPCWYISFLLSIVYYSVLFWWSNLSHIDHSLIAVSQL